MPNLTNSQEPEPQGDACFDPFEPEPVPLEKKYQEPELLRKKKSGAGAAWKKIRSRSIKKIMRLHSPAFLHLKSSKKYGHGP